MRHFVRVAILLACVPVAAAQSSEKQPLPADQRDVIQQLEAEWLKAERTTDTVILGNVMAEDFVGVGSNGLTPGKAQLLKNWASHVGQAPPYTVETAEMRIVVLGDTAVAAYVKTYTAKENSHVAHEDVTDVFTNNRGAWKLRFSRSSLH